MLPRICGVFACLLTLAWQTSARADNPCTSSMGIGATVGRPGTGRIPATSGSACVVAPNDVLVEFGYRDQTTSGNDATSHLSTYPEIIVRAGIGHGNEITVLPPPFSLRSGFVPGVFTAAIGTADAGIGIKHQISATANLQSAVSFFYTAPTGLHGANGFSAGAPTYNATGAAAFTLSPNLSITLNASVTSTAGANSSGNTERFISWNPAITLGVALSPRTTLVVQESVTTPIGPGAGSGNRVLLGLQHIVARRFILDIEREINALPRAGTHAQAVGVGAAILIGP